MLASRRHDLVQHGLTDQLPCLLRGLLQLIRDVGDEVRHAAVRALEFIVSDGYAAIGAALATMMLRLCAALRRLWHADGVAGRQAALLIVPVLAEVLHKKIC